VERSGAFRLGKARQVRHGTFRRVLVRYVQDRHSRSGEVCWGMVRCCADWFVKAGGVRRG